MFTERLFLNSTRSRLLIRGLQYQKQQKLHNNKNTQKTKMKHENMNYAIMNVIFCLLIRFFFVSDTATIDYAISTPPAET